jgi:hypothetical protein
MDLGLLSCKFTYWAIRRSRHAKGTGFKKKREREYMKEKRRYWEFKEKALDRTLWRTSFGRGYGPVVRQTAE